jgi:hypothetical protein
VEGAKSAVRKTIRRLLSEGDAVTIENVAVALRAIARISHVPQEHEAAAEGSKKVA